MAKKGQKQSNYSDDLIQIILDEYKKSRNIKTISKKYGISEGTIKTWTFKLNHPEKFLGKGQKSIMLTERILHLRI